MKVRYRIETIRHFEIDGETPWVAVTNFVRTQTGQPRPTLTPEHELGIDLVELYPHDDGTFAAAMARERLPDGRQLIAYAGLSPSR